MHWIMKTSSVTAINEIEAAVSPAVSFHFNGKEIFFIARTLSSLEIQSCGNFSLVNLDSDTPKDSKEDPIVAMAKFAEIQHKVLKLAMISPTYEEVEQVLFKHAGVDDFPKRMEEIKTQFVFEKDSKKKMAMEKEFAILEMRSKFIFPQDFLIEMFEFATEQKKSDVRKLVSEDILLEASILAEKGRCRVSDILCADGYFSEFNKLDIDKRGAVVLYNHRKKGK